MPIGPIDQQTFGAAVVTKTLDYMNNARSTPAPVDGRSFGAAVVSKTLDYMNSPQPSGPNNAADYDFQKSVLSGAMAMKGGIVNDMG